MRAMAAIHHRLPGEITVSAPDCWPKGERDHVSLRRPRISADGWFDPSRRATVATITWGAPGRTGATGIADQARRVSTVDDRDVGRPVRRQRSRAFSHARMPPCTFALANVRPAS